MEHNQDFSVTEVVPEDVLASQQVIEALEEDIDVNKVFHPRLAEAVSEAATAKGAPVEWYITFLLPILASLIGCCSISATTTYLQPFVLFSLVLASTGTGKTPVLNECMAPLGPIQNKLSKEYKNAHTDWLKLPDEEKKNTKEPSEPLLHTEMYTTESLRDVSNAMGGMLVRANEAEHHFKMMGAYKKGAGQGADGIFWNLLHDGSALNTTLVKGKSPMPHPRISFVGTGHPDATPLAMKSAFGDNQETDVRGASARYLICMKKSQLSRIQLGKPQHPLKSILTEVYGKLADYPVGKDSEDQHDELRYFEFTPEAQNRLVELRDEVNEHLTSANEEAVRALYPKMEANAIRIAGVLHVVNNLIETKWTTGIPYFISVQTFEVAIVLAKYYVRQAEAVFRLNRTGELDPIGAKIYGFIERKSHKGATFREIQQGIKARKGEDRLNQEKIKPAVNLLLDSGRVLQSGGRFYDSKLNGIVDTVANVLPSIPTPENESESAIQLSVVDVDTAPDNLGMSVPKSVNDSETHQQSNNLPETLLTETLSPLDGPSTEVQQGQPTTPQDLYEEVI